MSNLPQQPTTSDQPGTRRPNLPARYSYTPLTWPQLVQGASESHRARVGHTNVYSSEPLGSLCSQSHAPPATNNSPSLQPAVQLGAIPNGEQPQSGVNILGANEWLGRYSNWQQLIAPSQGNVACNPPNHGMEFRRGEQDIHQYLRSWHARGVGRHFDNPHTARPVVGHLIGHVAPQTPEFLRALGEGSVSSSSIRHPAGYVFRSLPGREAVSTSTWNSRIPPPAPWQTTDQSAQETGASTSSTAQQKEAKVRVDVAKSKTDHAFSEPLHTAGVADGSRQRSQLYNNVCNRPALAKPSYSSPVLPLKPATNTQGEAAKSSNGPGLADDAPQIIPQVQGPNVNKIQTKSYGDEEFLDFVERYGSHIQRRGLVDDMTKQILAASDASLRKFVQDMSVVSKQTAGNVTQNLPNGSEGSKDPERPKEKRKAPEEPQDASLSKSQRKRRRNQRLKKETTANAVKVFINAVRMAATRKSISADGSDIREQAMLAEQGTALPWSLLNESDRQRLLDVGFAPPEEPEPEEPELAPKKEEITLDKPKELNASEQQKPDDRLSTVGYESLRKPEAAKVQEPDDRNMKRGHCPGSKHEAPRFLAPPSTGPKGDMSEKQGNPHQHASKKRGHHRPSELEMEQQRHETEANFALEAKAVLGEYLKQRADRCDVERVIEQNFAETQQEFVKLEGKDGEPEYVVWKEIVEMDRGRWREIAEID